MWHMGFYDKLGGNPTMVYHRLPVELCFGIPHVWTDKHVGT